MTVYVCVHMPRECVCERKDVHAYCSKMLAAQQKDYALAELWGGGGGTLHFRNLRYFRTQRAENTVNPIVFYDTSSTYREAYGKFFRSGTLLFDGSSSVPFFRIRSFCSFCFLFLVSFVFARARLHNNPAKVFPAVKVSTFLLLSLPFLGSNDCVFLFFPCTQSGKVKQASMVLRRRPSHHKDADTREVLPATLASPKFS